jgi:hypothetical protein
MRGFAKLLLIFGLTIAPPISVALACGAIDGKGYRCTPHVGSGSSGLVAELFFYFEDKHVHRAYLDTVLQSAQIETENLGPYSMTDVGMSWPDGYNLDKEELLLSVVGDPNSSYSCILMVQPLVEILAHFEPILDDLNASNGAAE